METRRRTIGLLVDYLEMPYSGKIIKGCIEAARKENINLIIYPGTSVNYQHMFLEEDNVPDMLSDNDYFQRTIVYEYAKHDPLDGIIIPIVTIGPGMTEQEQNQFLDSFGVPVMVLERQREGSSSLVFEQNGVELAIRHLVEDCGRTHIAYISGPKNNDDAKQRINDYHRMMEQYGLEYPEDYIVYGDFTPFCQDAIERMFAKYYKELDAICVANDSMCIALYQIMKKYGMTPGEEIAVTGYDNSDIAVDSEPRLTSVNADAEWMGEQAVYKLLKCIESRKSEQETLPIHLMRRASSGWTEQLDKEEKHEYATGLHNENSMKHVFINSIATDMLEYLNHRLDGLKSFAYDVQQAGFEEGYLYLQEQSFRQSSDAAWTLPGTHLEQVFYNQRTNQERIGSSKRCDISQLLSPVLEDGESHVLVCYPVRMRDEQYGILYLGYDVSFNMDIYSIANQLATALHIGSLVTQLAYATEAKSSFLANMSHEIRTPINAVLGMDEMILRESNEAHIRGYAMDIQSAGKNLLAIINDILDFSKIESGRMELVPVDYDFSSMIHDVMNMLVIKAQSKGLYMNLQIDEKLPSGLYGDDVRIRQILVNLINNAIKYTNVGGVTLSIQGEVEDEIARLRFEVSDTGIGIRQEDIEKLYVKFERIEEHRNRNIEGTGLGMNIVIQFLDMMGSKLCVQSEYGKGSSFSFELEQMVTHAEPIGNLEKRIQEQGHSCSYEATFTAPDAWVLVVDDNAVNRKVFKHLLKASGIKIDCADSGKACLDFARRNSYDIIFMDHMMSDMDGIETMQQLMTLPDNCSRDAALIALTANAISGAREMYLEAGFDGYMTKPIVPEKLERIIMEFLPPEKVHEREGRPDTNPNIPENIDTNMGEEHLSSNIEKKLDRIARIPEINLDYARLFNTDSEFLLELLDDFYEMLKPDAEMLTQYYDALAAEVGDRKIMNWDMSRESAITDILKQYRIKVHAMKSSAAMVGAVGLSGVALCLEKAAESGKVDTVLRLSPAFVDEWLSYRDKLDMCGEGQTAGTLDTEADCITEEDCIEEAALTEETDLIGEIAKDRILVVDDSLMNQKNAKRILEGQFEVHCCSSGLEAIGYLQQEMVDLILLDLHMPDMDGFAVADVLKCDARLQSIPVIFMTADKNQEAEIRGFEKGALDFITKPFVVEIMLQRIHRILELSHLQKDLSKEVAKQTYLSEERRKKVERLSMQAMKTLAAAIDAKDRYTNGHSLRVAEYSKMLAARMGKSEKEQEDIYYIGLLHDVGKIGIPDEIINKTSRLTDEEFDVIKTHPVIGMSILKNISEIPNVAVGAHWHHERYNGTGYPDGLAGTEIPEVARIIGVADAYDAMTSNRSYRKGLEQAVVRSEVERGKGTQFDPVIAEYMLQIIDEDAEYQLRENTD